MTKPNVFNYGRYEEALEEIEELKRTNTNLAIENRILKNGCIDRGYVLEILCGHCTQKCDGILKCAQYYAINSIERR